MAEKDTSLRPNGFLKICLTNRIAIIENERCIEKLRTELGRGAISIYAKHPLRDIETQILSVDISDNQIYKTGNLPGKLKVYIGQELLMLTANINTSGSFISK